MWLAGPSTSSLCQPDTPIIHQKWDRGDNEHGVGEEARRSKVELGVLGCQPPKLLLANQRTRVRGRFQGFIATTHVIYMRVGDDRRGRAKPSPCDIPSGPISYTCSSL